MTYSVLRDSLHLVMLPKFYEVGGDLLLTDQDHIANTVEPKLGFQLLRLQNACSKGCFLNAFPISLLALFTEAYVFPFAVTYRDLFLNAPEKAIIDLAKFLGKKQVFLSPFKQLAESAAQSRSLRKETESVFPDM